MSAIASKYSYSLEGCVNKNYFVEDRWSVGLRGSLAFVRIRSSVRTAPAAPVPSKELTNILTLSRCVILLLSSREIILNVALHNEASQDVTQRYFTTLGTYWFKVNIAIY